MTYYGLAGDRYLAHHGILGMKWGVRRYQNKDGSLTPAGKKRYYSKEELKGIRADRSSKYKEYFVSDEDYKKARQLQKQAYDLSNKYDFDADDGGGGTTRTDAAAGRKYRQLLDESFLLDDSAQVNARKKTEQYIKDTYGSVAIEQLNQQDMERGFVTAAAFMAIPIAAIIGIGILDSKTRR